MAVRYLIDTSGVIKYLNGTLPEKSLKMIDEIIDKECLISFVSEIELQVWNPKSEVDLEIYKEFVKGSIIIPLNQQIIDVTITIRKQYNVKLPDALIASSCIVENYTLIADNDKDFSKVANLKYLNPNK